MYEVYFGIFGFVWFCFAKHWAYDDPQFTDEEN